MYTDIDKRGRISIYKAKYETDVEPRLKEIEAWARDGLSVKDIAHNLGIVKSTLCRYKNLHSDLADALAHGKKYVDDVIVTNAYLRRVTGYDVTEVKREYVHKEDDDGNKVRVLTKETEQTRHIPGDPRAAEFWLCNRAPDKWRRIPSDNSDADGEGGVVVLPKVMDIPEVADNA